MNRVRFVFGATLFGATIVTGSAAWAQAPAAQAPLTTILAGKKFTPPIRGAVDVDFTKPSTSRVKDLIVTKIQVKNMSNGPIARLKVDETWYDKGGATVAGGTGVINGLIQPGEVQTLTIETPYNGKMSANNWAFAHANGSVKPHRVDKFEGDAKDKAPAKK